MRIFRVVLILANGALFAWACGIWKERLPASSTDWVVALALTSVPFMNLIYLFFHRASALPSIGIFRLWLDAKEAELKARAEIARASIKQDHKVP